MRTDELVQLVYPQRRVVTRTWLMVQHADAVENGELEEHTNSLSRAIYDLEDLGHITVWKTS